MVLRWLPNEKERKSDKIDSGDEKRIITSDRLGRF